MSNIIKVNVQKEFFISVNKITWLNYHTNVANSYK